MSERGFPVVEASIAELRRALDDGVVSCVELVAAYLNRIAKYDRHGPTLNSIVVFNPDMFADARAADLRRHNGAVLSVLDGVPYTAKNSFKVRGLTVAAGSPAFEHLVASEDSFTIERLRGAGAVLLGLTNMPPMANGGMQRGLYGRAESPYNSEYLTAAFGSGSSNGSGTATAASFAAFGLGEETWSSGRAPASNNGLCAYTPSRGVISTRGNWPLVPTMDVVVPHARTMDDLFAVLNELVSDDRQSRGDFWRVQPWISIPKASQTRPRTYAELRDPEALRGRRIGIPRMYVNGEPDSPDSIQTRESIIALWQQAREDLETLGAEVIDVDFPVVTNYESFGPGATNMVARSRVPAGFARHELMELSMLGWHDFLDANGDTALHALADVNPERIFPHPIGALPDHYGEHGHRFSPDDISLEDYVAHARRDGITPLEQIPDIQEGLEGLEATRASDFEEWMTGLGLHAVVFPAVADVAPADADVNPDSATKAWRNGVWVANANLVPRHLGIPTVTVPLGIMSDIGMPVGLTFAGPAYGDSELLCLAWAFEHVRVRRFAPSFTPELPRCVPTPTENRTEPQLTLNVHSELGSEVDDTVEIVVRVATNAAEIAVFVNGESLVVHPAAAGFTAHCLVATLEHERIHSEWRAGYGSVVVVTAASSDGQTLGAYAVVGGVA